MPEKTLKDKVDAARINLASITHVSHFDVKNVFEALTALEERVKELEKERALIAGWYETEFGWNFEEHVRELTEDASNKEPPNDGK